MIDEFLGSVLVKRGFTYERESEYNRDVYHTDTFGVDGFSTRLEIYVDYHTLRFVWWHQANRKLGKSYYRSKLDFCDENGVFAFINEFINYCKSTYNPKLGDYKTSK